MGKLIFTHGTMSSGKSSTLIQKEFEFSKCGKKVTVLRPSFDTRTESGKVSSRIGISCDAISISKGQNIVEQVLAVGVPEVVLVDEANFFTEEHVEQLAVLADEYSCLVLAFGLKSDFESRLFPASKRLLELADRIDEQSSMCNFCTTKATMHIRLTDEKEQMVCGDDIYRSVCRKCFNKFKRKEED